MTKKQLKKALILSFFIVGVLMKQTAIKAEEILPIFDYESTQTFQPDIKTVKPKNELKPEIKVVAATETEDSKAEEDDLARPIQFQLADPKKMYVPSSKKTSPKVSVKEEKLTIKSVKDETEKVVPKNENKTALEVPKTETKTEELPEKLENKPDKTIMTLEEETRRLQEQKDKLEEERLKLEKQLKEKELAQKQAEEEKKLAEIERKKQEEAARKAEEKRIKQEQKEKEKEAKRQARLAEKLQREKEKQEEARKQAELEKQKEEEAKKLAEIERLKQEETQKALEEEKVKQEEALKQPEIEKQKKINEDKANQEKVELEHNLKKEEDKVDLTKVDTVKIEDNKIIENKNLQDEKQPSNIDYYLKKYTATMESEDKQEELPVTSLMEPFKKSLFYTVLKENKYETIELVTKDLTGNFKPEAVVSYNVPLGGEGEYACQLMVLQSDKGELSKLWVSELIPGEIDTVMVQDINNDAQNDIVVISTTGGVSLLKSIRVYTYDKMKDNFKTIYAMNGIMEGIVSVKSGKILVSETFPGGVNRAALYVWNGKRFERLEL